MDRGVVLRPLDTADEDDVAAAFAIVRDCETHAGGYSDATPDSVRAQLTSPDALRDLARVALVDGTPRGLLVIERAAGSDTVFVDAYGAGPAAGEVEDVLVGEALSLVSGLDGVARITAGAYGADEVYPEILRRHGFTAVRRFWRMRQDLSGVAPEPPDAPAGVTLRTATTPEDLRLLHAMRAATFADHFGHEARAFEDYVAVLEASAGADPQGRWVVLLDGQAVGLLIVDDSHAEFGEGYVRTLGLVPSVRGRGIARWLLAVAAAHAVARGRTANALTVDGENATGATSLYLSAGYEVREVIDVFEARLSAESR